VDAISWRLHAEGPQDDDNKPDQVLRLLETASLDDMEALWQQAKESE